MARAVVRSFCACTAMLGARPNRSLRNWRRLPLSIFMFFNWFIFVLDIYIYIYINGPISYHLPLQPFKVLKGGCMALPFMVLKTHFHPKQRPKGTNVEKKAKRKAWLEKKWRQIWTWISTNEKNKTRKLPETRVNLKKEGSNYIYKN